MRYLAIGIALVLLASLYGCSGEPINQGMTKDGRPYRGSATPKVVIYEYSDFQCPFCSKAQPTIEQLLRAYPADVQVQFRFFPLDTHPQAFGAALAGECAEQQGASAFWKMHDLMFAHQDALLDSDLKGYAAQAGLAAQKFEQCFGSSEAAAKVRADMAEGASVRVQATPTFQIGESQVMGAQPFAKFKSVIDSEIARVG